jgi:predicted peroxiredoxin
MLPRIARFLPWDYTDMGTSSAGGTAGMKILIKSAWGSDDPTKAAFAFLHSNAFAEAGHEVRIFLLGEAVNLMKDEVIAAVTPVGWPPLSEIVPKTITHGVPLNI